MDCIWQRPKVVQVFTAIRQIVGSWIHACGITFVHFDVWKIPTFLGMMNIEPNLRSLG